MEKSLSGPAGDRAEDLQDNSKVAAIEFKPYAQSRLPDNREFKGDLLNSLIRVRRAQLALMDEIYTLENFLEEVLDRDEGGRC